ncbi:two-component sensor histidine kinase, partial [Campylobacter coli]|nr:two-component sensor histidine kinase [Campylobacter coli]
EIKDENAVFEAFKTTKLKGNGLGLSLSKEIINAHKGELKFEIQPKNFYFVLPLH